MTSILHLIASLEGGGAERQLVMLANEQVRRGREVHLGVRRGGVFAKQLDPRIAVHELGDHAGGDPRLFASVMRLVRAARPALIQTWLPQMDIVGGAIAIATRTPWVMTERANAEAYRTHRIALALRRLLVPRTVVANSAAGAALWSRGQVIGNAVDVDAITRATPLPASDALWVGRLVPDKDPETFVAAARALAMDPLVFGEGPVRIAARPFSETWWGHLRTAAMLVSTSRTEGQPNVVLEAMAAGCPLIVTAIAAHRELLDERSALFFPVGDVDALVAAMRTVRAQPELAAERAARAKLRVADRTIARIADAYDAVYVDRTRNTAR